MCTWANYYAVVTIHNHDALGVFILSLESNASTLAITSVPSNVLSNQTFIADYLKKASLARKAVAQLLLGTCLFWWGRIGFDLRYVNPQVNVVLYSLRTAYVIKAVTPYKYKKVPEMWSFQRFFSGN